jgi:transposase, IS5 family
MRQKMDPQPNLFHGVGMQRTEIGRELQAMSLILDKNRDILDPVYKDLIGVKDAGTGRTGMTAEQAVRVAILKQYRNLTYEELAFHLADSTAFMAFAKLGRGQYPSASTLQENVKAISEGAWEEIVRALIRYAAAEGVEKGRVVRVDSTATETNIHYPQDSRLLQDAIMVITRLLAVGKEMTPAPGSQYSNHERVVKKQVAKIRDTKKEEVRVKCYKALLGIARQVKGYALKAIEVLNAYHGADVIESLRARVLAEELERVLDLFERVIDQTTRRVIDGEKVPAREKLFSIFECHTDIIEKGNRETVYGHKLFLSTGKSGMILDFKVERGNPADSSMFLPLMHRQKDIFKRPPRQAAGDGGFASADNLDKAKEMGIKDVCFSKRKGLDILDMVKSKWVYKQLRNFRAGIEAGISTLKRSFGLTRCTWTGWDGFLRYVGSAAVSFNLVMLARLLDLNQ